MKHKNQVLALLLALSLLFGTGCGATGRAQKKGQGTAAGGEKSVEMEAGDALGEEGTENGKAEGIGEAEGGEESAEPKDTVGKLKIDRVNFSTKEKLVYGDWEIEVVGFEEKKKVESEQYTDTAADGMVYLLLYLKLYNKTDSDYYFAPDMLVTKVDGKKVEPSFLYNSPHDYESLYRHFESDDLSAGFLAWEVPENWEKLKLVYHGWETEHFMIPVLKLSRKDLFEPELYRKQYLEY